MEESTVKFYKGQRVKFTDWAIKQFPRRKVRTGVVFSALRQHRGFIRVTLDGNKNPETYSIKFWQPAEAPPHE